MRRKTPRSLCAGGAPLGLPDVVLVERRLRLRSSGCRRCVHHGVDRDVHELVRAHAGGGRASDVLLHAAGCLRGMPIVSNSGFPQTDLRSEGGGPPKNPPDWASQSPELDEDGCYLHRMMRRRRLLRSRAGSADLLGTARFISTASEGGTHGRPIPRSVRPTPAGASVDLPPILASSVPSSQPLVRLQHTPNRCARSGQGESHAPPCRDRISRQNA